MSAARTPTLALPLRKECALNHGDMPPGSRLFHVRDAHNNAVGCQLEEHEADALVLRCNSHDALVAALEQLDEDDRLTCANSSLELRAGACRCSGCRASAALAAAKGAA